MPPVEFDTIPRFVSSSTEEGKNSVAASNFLELGSFEPIITRSKGSAPQPSEAIEDVEVPEIDSEDETTIDKIMKDYSEEESADDSDYVPSCEDSEDEADSTSNDFVITRSKGIPPQDSGIVKDVEIPEVDSEDEMTVDKILKNYSDVEEASGDDSDYFPSEASEDEELEYDSDASISDDEECQEIIEDVVIPKASFPRRSKRVVIEDVKIPKISNAVVLDVPVGHPQLSNDVLDHLAGFTIVQTGIKVLDFGLEMCQELLSAPYKEHVQGVRRHLRAIRRSGKGSAREGFFSFFIELFMVNWFLSFIGLTLNVDSSSKHELRSSRSGSSEDEFCDDDESTVYKLMKDYDSQDDEDYVPADCSEDSMEFESDCSEDETVVEKLMKDYSEGEDSVYVPSSEESEDEEGIEYDSEAEVSEDSDYDSSDVEESEDDETIVEKIMKDYSEEESDFDADYVPGEEEAEDDIEFESDASISDTEDSEESATDEVEYDHEDVEEGGSQVDDEE